jgi:hypothetical protein
VPKDLSYLHALCNLAVSAIALDDRGRAERLYALLSPYALLNTPNILGFYEGPVAHFLGLLAVFLDDDAAAEQQFMQAIADNERLGLRPLLARTHLAYASCVMRRRRRDGEAHQARAIELSEGIGMHWLADQARKLGSTVRVSAG